MTPDPCGEMITIRFFGRSEFFNGVPLTWAWDYKTNFTSLDDAACAVEDYLNRHDDDIAHYEEVK